MIESRLRDRSQLLLHAGCPGALAEAIGDFVLAGGKRIRPQLCVWAYLHSTGCQEQGAGDSTRRDSAGHDSTGHDSAGHDSAGHDSAGHDSARHISAAGERDARAAELPSDLLDVACAWEMFHAFLLAHDDIIDNADTRRGAPSLHRRLEALDGHCPRFGQNMAIVAGDLLFGLSIRLLHDLDVPDSAYRPLLRLFSRIACETGAGQADDIAQSHAPLDGATASDLLNTCQRKTAAYTFEGPILSGAILAGIPAEAHRPISAFASAIGKVYQIQNDLDDLSHSAHAGCDLIQGKRTLVLLQGRAAMNPATRSEFDRQLDALPGANGQSIRIAEILRRDLLATGAVQFARQVIAGLLADAHAAASDPAIPPGLSDSLHCLLRRAGAEYAVPA